MQTKKLFCQRSKTTKSKKVLLYQPVDEKFEPKGLMKFSTYYKQKGYKIRFCRSTDIEVLRSQFDVICVDFGYLENNFQESLELTKWVVNRFPNADVLIGGVLASKNYEELCEIFGKKRVHFGVVKYLEGIKEDLSLVNSEVSRIFTTRGCPRNCPYCCVTKIEGAEVKIIPNWKDQIDLKKKELIIQDNNILVAPLEHIKEVVDFIIEHRLDVDLNSGFDPFFSVRYPEKVKEVVRAKSRLKCVRIAFDRLQNEVAYRKAVEIWTSLGIRPANIWSFMLVGFETTARQDLYRLDIMRELGTIPFVMPYQKNEWTRWLARVVNRKWIYKTWTWREEAEEKIKEMSNNDTSNVIYYEIKKSIPILQ